VYGKRAGVPFILHNDRRHLLRLVRRALFVPLLILIVGCDPGVSIHQIKSHGQASTGSLTSRPQVVIDVITRAQLIHETWYDPKVNVSNESNLPVTVTDIELSVRSKTFANELADQAWGYPTTIPPGGTKVLYVQFRLDEDVQETFREPAELLLHYRIGEKQEIAHATVIGGRLGDRR
jgi:hypothetical protein